jgi:hypothetical protein
MTVSGAFVPGAAAELQHAWEEYEAFAARVQELPSGNRVKSM